MAFNNTVIEKHDDMMAGEVLKSKPHNVEAFEQFEDGLVVGRFAKYDTGSIDNIDGSDDPLIAGIVRRKITGEIGDGVYSTSGPEIDQVAEIINFGFATVTVTDDASPSKYDDVNIINDDTVDHGKATDADVGDGIISAGDVVFWEEKQDGVWLVRFNKYV